MAAARALIPLLTGGAVLTAAVAVAYARRPSRMPASAGEQTARLEPEQVGPDDGMVEVLALASGSNPTARNEAEAITGAGAGWPAFETEPVSARGYGFGPPSAPYAPLGSEEGRMESSPPEGEPSALKSGIHSGFTEVEPAQAFLDIDIDFEDPVPSSEADPLSTLEIPELAQLEDANDEHYDALAPEDLGSEWLARATESPRDAGGNPFDPATLDGLGITPMEPLEHMDTLEDIGEAPTDPWGTAAKRALANAEAGEEEPGRMASLDGRTRRS